MARRTLGNLFAATEAVGDDQPVGRSLADGWHQFEFADGDGDVVFIGFEAEGASHAATAGGGTLEVDAEAAEDGLFGGHLHEGFVMAVAVEERFALEVRQWETPRVGFEELAKKKSLARQSLGPLIVGK